jgi:sugar/nucleoside kinase (ribokinase family)
MANTDEATVLSAGAPLRDLVEVAAVVKRGAGGAVWSGADGATVEVPGEPTTVVDPTGAGDAFAAGLLRAWLAGASPEASLRAGTRLGALAVGRVGGRP